jgi:hypothetical protein
MCRIRIVRNVTAAFALFFPTLLTLVLTRKDTQNAFDLTWGTRARSPAFDPYADLSPALNRKSLIDPYV